MLFSNWLTATIIQCYDVDSKEKSLSKASTGTVSVSIIDEIILVRNKYIRSVRLFIKGIINYIKKVKDLKNIITKKSKNKKDKKKTSEKKDLKDVGINNRDNEEQDGSDRDKEPSSDRDKEPASDRDKEPASDRDNEPASDR